MRFKKPDRYNLLFMLIMALFLIWGLLAFKDYGLSWDEEVQRARGLAGLRTAITLVAGEDAVPDRLNSSDVTARGYGVLGIKLPVVLAEYATGFSMSPERVFKLYHLYNFLLFYISAVFLYALLITLDFERGYALTGLLLYILCPRILADSFYNSKDLVFLSLFTMSLSLGAAVVKEFKWGRALCLGIVTAFMLTVRTAGAFGVVVFAFYFLIRSLMSKKPEDIVRDILRLFFTVLSCVLVLIAITPKMWINFAKAAASKVSVMFGFSHGGFDLILGQLYNRLDLPWYYLPLTIALTVPCIYIIFTLTGLVLFFIRALRRYRIRGNRCEEMLLFLLFIQFVFILGYTMVIRPMQYNLWRHFYFVFVYIVIFTIYGIRLAISGTGRGGAWFVRIFTALSLILTILWIGKNHPYEYLYFNPLFLNRGAKETVQDYWAVSYKGLLSQIVDGSTADVYIYPTLTGNQYFGWAGWENFHLEPLKNSAKYRIEEGNPGENAFYKILKTVEVDGRICESLVRRENYGNVIRRYYIEKGEVKGKCDAEITVCTQGTDSCILVRLPRDLNVRELDVLYGGMYRLPAAEGDEEEREEAPDKELILSGERIFLSKDGESFYSPDPEHEMREDDMMGVSAQDDFLPEYVLFKYENRSEKLPDFSLWLYGDDEGSSDRDDVYYNRFEAAEAVRGLEGSPAAKDGRDVMKLLDGREDTAYMTNRTGGPVYFEFEVEGNVLPLRGLHIDCGAYPMGAGRDIVIEGSADGISYSEIPWHYGAADDYLFDTDSTCRYYTVKEQGESSYPWYISELGLIRRRDS